MKTPVEGLNDPLKSAIASYLQRVTDYALLVTGPWGSGKTFQVNASLKTSHNERLYMSAAGASSIEDLSFRLVVASAPFLGTKFANITEQIISGLLSKAKIDYKLKLSDFAKVPKTAVIIIDDIERFTGNISVPLAFANSLVEQSDRKVILLAAENELTGNRRKIFFTTKEKVVGRQLEVKPDPKGVIQGVLYRIPANYQKFLTDNADHLEVVFDRLGRGNLRTLKRFIFDFLPVFEGLNSSSELPTDTLVRVAQTLLAFTLPARRHDIEREMITRRPESAYTAAFLENASKKSPLEPLLQVGKSIPEIDIYDQAIGDDLLMAFVFEGFVAESLLERTKNDLLIGSGKSASQPWRVLWRYLDIDESEFNAALSTFLDQFFKRQILDPGEVIHAFGVLFELSEAKLIPYTQEQITDMADSYSEEIVNNPAFDLTLGGVLDDIRYGSAHGLQFHQLKNPRMQDAMAKLRDASEERRQTNLVNRFDEAFEVGRNFNAEVPTEILFGSTPSTSLKRVAFLQRVDPANVARTIVYERPEVQGSVLRALNNRLSEAPDAVVNVERPWVSELIQALNAELEKNKSDLVKRRVTQMIDWYLAPLVTAGPPQDETEGR